MVDSIVTFYVPTSACVHLYVYCIIIYITCKYEHVHVHKLCGQAVYFKSQ